MDLRELISSNPLAQFGTLKPGQLPAPGPPTAWDKMRDLADAPGNAMANLPDVGGLPLPTLLLLSMGGAPRGGLPRIENAMPPGPGAPSAAQSMPVPESTVQSHIAQMRPLPNQGVKPTPEVLATEGMPGDAAEALINQQMGIRAGAPPIRNFNQTQWWQQNAFPFQGKAAPFQEGSQMVSNPRFQETMLRKANERIGNINAANAQWGMPPIPNESPLAALAPRTNLPGVLGPSNNPSLESLLRFGAINSNLGPTQGMRGMVDQKIGNRLLDLMYNNEPGREMRFPRGRFSR